MSQATDLRASATWDATVGGVQVRFGRGRLAELGRVVAALGSRRPLLVTDGGVRRAGHAGAAETLLRQACETVDAYDGVQENPTTADVERGAAAAAGLGTDCIVAVGGGSVMDTAKGINLLLTSGGRMADYAGYGRAVAAPLPAVGVPTTAGTGSEAQSYAVIADAETGAKMACGDRGALFRTALLDPALPATAPRRVVATAGLDALSHAVESFVSTRRSPISSRYARRAWLLLDGAYETVLTEPAKESAWAEMLLGSHLAGAAIEHSMLGAAHASANPLTARHGVEHGAAVLLMLPWVVRFNAPEVGALYRELIGDGARPDPAAALAGRLETLRAAGGQPATLREVGIERSGLDELARLATEQWTGRFNPRPVDRRGFRSLYDAAY